MENENLMLDIHRESAEFGFWDEIHKSTIIYSIESFYKKEILKYWSIIDVIITEGKYLTKWNKRFKPLTKEELNEKYGK